MNTIFKPLVLVVILVSGMPTAFAEPDVDYAHFDVEAATRAYMDSLDPEQLAITDAYYEGGYWLDFWELLYSLLIAWILLNFALSTRMRDFGERISRFTFVRLTSYIFIYTLLVSIFSFPYLVYRFFIREHDYGLSNLSFIEWFGEQLIGLGIQVVLSCIGIALIYLIIRKAPKKWPLWGAITAFVMLGFIVLISPVYLSPLFNDYQPLEEGPLKERILSMARANAVPADDVYMFDASKQSNRISANVSGLFGTTRISLNDNLLNRTSAAGVEAVMAHEIGHYALNHGPKLLVSLGLIIAVGFAFVAWAFDRVNKPAWGIRDISDIAGLPLLLALFSVYLFLMTPVLNSIVRISETEADIFGLNAARQPDGFAEGMLGLAEYRKMKPGAWEEIIFFDHPSGYTRIHMAMRWKKENLQSLAEN